MINNPDDFLEKRHFHKAGNSKEVTLTVPYLFTYQEKDISLKTLLFPLSMNMHNCLCYLRV